MSGIKLNLIATVCENNMGIGVRGTIPWRLENDIEFFTAITSAVEDESKQNAVIIGRVAWDSIPLIKKPLANRLNIVITGSPYAVQQRAPPGVEAVKSLDEAIKLIERRKDIEKTWVIGGAQVYKAALEHPNCDKIYLTEIQKFYECDTFFPEMDKGVFRLDYNNDVDPKTKVEDGVEYYMRVYKKCY